MNILVLDDEPLARQELEYLLKQNPQVEAVFQAASIAEGLQLLISKKIDLLFLDIDLNDENGFTLAKDLDQLANPPLVIFATAYGSYAVDAFNIDAIDYVLKPFEQARVDQAVEKANSLLKTPVEPSTTTPTATVITITQDEKTRVIQMTDIRYAVINNGELTITTHDDQLMTRETLNWLKVRLDSDQFIQVHRSVLVNVADIHEIQPWFNHTYQLTMSDGQKLPVGRSFIKPLRERLRM